MLLILKSSLKQKLRKQKAYRSKAKAIIVTIKTWVKSSQRVVAAAQPNSPKVHGYDLSSIFISSGATELL